MVMILMLKMLTKYQGDQGTKVMSTIMMYLDQSDQGTKVISAIMM